MSRSSHSDDHADSDVSFDESEIRERLNQMDKESLIDFMQKKGNERKQAIYDWMIFQTKDAEFSEIFVGKFEDKVEEKRQKLQEIDDGVNKFSKIFEEAEQDLEKCN